MLEGKQRAPGPARSDSGRWLSIAEAARRNGLSMHGLRYCELADRVIAGIDRTGGGRRRYQQRDLDWIAVHSKLPATGMPI